MDCHALFQGIFPTQGSNPSLLGLMDCRRILYCLRHQGSPVIRLLDIILYVMGLYSVYFPLPLVFLTPKVQFGSFFFVLFLWDYLYLKKTHIQLVLVYSLNYAHYHHLNSRMFLSLQKEITIPISSHSSFSPPLSPWKSLISISIDLPVLNISYKWNYTICDFLGSGFFHWECFQDSPTL